VSDIERPSNEIERRPRHVVVSPEESGYQYIVDPDPESDEGFYDDETGVDWTRLKELLRRHQVSVVCVALIVVTLVWKTVFISHFYFQQDDFSVLDAGLHSKLSWAFLTHDDEGHLFPGVYAIAWVLARIALYNWTAATAVTVAMIAASSLAAWRLLRTLLGNRPAIVIPLALYLCSPLAFPVYAWWVTAIEALPLQIALFMSLDAHLRYTWTSKFRYAVAAGAWLVFGLVFFEKSALIPLLLFAVTAGFLTQRPLLRSIWLTLTRLWRAWVLYLVILAGYAAVFVLSMRAAKVRSTPATAGQAATFASDLLRQTFLPGMLGGPWRWFPIVTTLPGGAASPAPATAVTAPSSALALVALLIVAAIIVASIMTRRKAWRAWAILAGWIALDDVLPVVLGRLSYANAYEILGYDARYVTDTTAVAAIAIALAFWPVAAPEHKTAGASHRRRVFFAGPWKAIALGLVGVFVVGSVWSVQQFTQTANGSYVRSYLTTAQAALAQVPAGTAIFGAGQVSPGVMTGLFGTSAAAADVIEPLSHRGAQLTWLTRPYGTIDNLMAFSQDTGQLYPATIVPLYSSTSEPLTGTQICNSPASGRFTYRFASPTSILTLALQIGYTASPALAGRTMTVTYGHLVRQVRIEGDIHTAWVPVSGSATDVVIQVGRAPRPARPPAARKGRKPVTSAASYNFCVAPTLTAGDIGAATTGRAYPALPATSG
jgi:hypothetical protein